MKATGIVRRIDDLGRVVIPKEIRRTIRIREGDPLEIYLSDDGKGVCFHKYCPLEINEDVTRIAMTMANNAGLRPIAIYDRDCRILGNTPFPEVVPSEWEDYLNMNKNVYGFGVYPILCSGEALGYVVCQGKDMGVEMDMIQRYLSAALDY